jgi:hypothetical protein
LPDFVFNYRSWFWLQWGRRDWRSRPRLTRQWLSELGEDALQSQQELLKRLNAFICKTGPMGRGNWEVLGLIETAGSANSRELENRYLFHTNPENARDRLLQSQILPWHRNVGSLYQAFVNQVVATGRAHPLAKEFPHMLAGALHHCGRELLWRQGLGEQVESDFWHRVHGLYRLAVSAGITRHTVRLVATNEPVAPEGLYLEAMLLGLLAEHGFSASQMHVLAHALRYWMPRLNLDGHHDARRHTHMMDTMGHSTASRLDTDMSTDGGNLLFLDIRPLLGLLDMTVSALQAHRIPDDMPLPLAFRLTGYQAVLEAAAEAWGGDYCRVQRDAVDPVSSVWVVAGWPTVIEVLEWTAQGCAGGERSTGWRVRGKAGPHITLFGAENSLDRGMGELVGLREPTADGMWQLGVVRWLRYREMNERTVGVEILGTAARPVGVVYADRRTVDTGILLPKVDNKGIANTVILREQHLKPGMLFELHDSKVVYRIRLGEVLESQKKWGQARFDILERIGC